jgi:hypothetical protein
VLFGGEELDATAGRDSGLSELSMSTDAFLARARARE